MVISKLDTDKNFVGDCFSFSVLCFRCSAYHKYSHVSVKTQQFLHNHDNLMKIDENKRTNSILKKGGMWYVD